MKKVLAVLAGVGLIATVSVVGPTIAGTKNHGEDTIPCGDGSITTTPTALWPPNHKDVPVSFTYVDNDDDDVTLEIAANPHNEIVDDEEINGTGNTPAATDAVGGANTDSDGDVTVEGSARAERSGHKNEDGGRVYEFDYVADDGGTLDGCASEAGPNGDGILIFVPHDCRGGACQG